MWLVGLASMYNIPCLLSVMLLAHSIYAVLPILRSMFVIAADSIFSLQDFISLCSKKRKEITMC